MRHSPLTPRVFFGSSASFRPPGSVDARRARVDVRRRRIERLAGGDGGVAFVVLRRIAATSGGGGISARSGFLSGMNSPTVRFDGLKYVLATRCTSSGVTLRMRSRLRKNRRQSPGADRLAQRQADAVGGVERQLDVLEHAGARAIDFFLRRRRRLQRRRSSAAVVSRVVERLLLPHLGGRVTNPGIVQLPGMKPPTRRRFLRLDQRLVEPARGRVAEDARPAPATAAKSGCDAGRHVIGDARRACTSPTRRSVTARSPSCAGSAV